MPPRIRVIDLSFMVVARRAVPRNLLENSCMVDLPTIHASALILLAVSSKSFAGLRMGHLFCLIRPSSALIMWHVTYGFR